MCAKFELAESLAALGMDITSTLCRSKAERTESGEAETCPHAATCPYLAQLQDRQPGLILAAQQYVSLTVEGLKSDDIDLLIIDESFWPSTCRKGRVQTGRFLRPRGPGARMKHPKKGESRQEYELRILDAEADYRDIIYRSKRAIDAAEQAKRDINLEDFRTAGLTGALCTFAATVEYSRLGVPDVTAGMPEAEQRDRIRQAITDEALSFARVWKNLAVEIDLPRDQLISLRRNQNHWNAKAAQHEDVLETYYHTAPRIEGVPVVILDADLEPEIIRQYYPAAADRILDLDVEWSHVRVRQVIDRAVSKNMLAGGNPRQDEQQRHGNRREDLWQIMCDMAHRHGHPLSFSRKTTAEERARRPVLITYKKVEDEWAEEGRIEQGSEDSRPLRDALRFDVAHLGDIRGKDRWRHASGIVVAGRQEPTVRDVEAEARCLFFADHRALAFIQTPDADTQARYESTKRPIQLRDGRQIMVDVNCHPDTRIDAVLRQIREAEVRQALARIRPVHRRADQPCEVVIATSVPIPGVIVDEAVSWDDLTPDRIQRMEIAGFTPDLAADCAAAYPDLFRSADVARKARSRAALARLGVAGSDLDLGCDKAHLITLYGKGHTLSHSIRVEYQRETSKGGNRGGSGVVRAFAGDAEADIVARVLAALPDARHIHVVGPLPDAAQEPELAAHMLWSALDWLGSALETDDMGDVRPAEVVSLPCLAAPPPWAGPQASIH